MILPLLFPESDQYKLIGDQQRSLYQHPITTEEAEHLFFVHLWESVFQIQGPVQLTAGIEKKALQGNIASFKEIKKLRFVWTVLLDVTVGIRRLPRIKEGDGFFCMWNKLDNK